MMIYTIRGCVIIRNYPLTSALEFTTFPAEEIFTNFPVPTV